MLFPMERTGWYAVTHNKIFFVRMSACILCEHPRVPIPVRCTADCDSNRSSVAHADSSSPAFIDIHTTPHLHADNRSASNRNKPRPGTVDDMAGDSHRHSPCA